jgi:hypothetical protein
MSDQAIKIGRLDHEKGTMNRYKITYRGGEDDCLECGDTLELVDSTGEWTSYHIGCTPKGYQYLVRTKTNTRLRHIITGMPARKGSPSEEQPEA